MKIKIDEVEIKLAFNEPLISVPRSVVRLVRSNSLHLPLMYWRHGLRRSGLSPFVLAYLTNYPGGPAALHSWLMSNKNRDFFYAYCITTRLPVAYSRVGMDWYRSRCKIYSSSEVLVSNSLRRGQEVDSRQRAFDLWFPRWIEAKDNDEAMRTFSGHVICKETWSKLKALADAYV